MLVPYHTATHVPRHALPCQLPCKPQSLYFCLHWPGWHAVRSLSVFISASFRFFLPVTQLLRIEMATRSANRAPSFSEPASTSSLSSEALTLELSARNLTLRGPREARIDPLRATQTSDPEPERPRALRAGADTSATSRQNAQRAGHRGPRLHRATTRHARQPRGSGCPVCLKLSRVPGSCSAGQSPTCASAVNHAGRPPTGPSTGFSTGSPAAEGPSGGAGRPPHW